MNSCPEKSKRNRKRFSWGNDNVQIALMLFPMMAGFFLFTYVPILYLVRCSFFSSNGFKEQYVALKNFARIFTRDYDYWRAVATTFILALGKLAVQIPLALLLAVILNRGLKGTAFFRVILFLPAIIAGSIAGLAFSLLFASYNGMINGMLESINLPAVGWFEHTGTALFVIGLASIWNNFGVTMIFFLSALQTVPGELYECAAMDGITPVKRFFNITLPMIGPTFTAVLLLGIIGALKMADLILASTNGQPSGGTEVVMTYVFKYFFGYDLRQTEIGYASAMAVVTAFILALVALIYNRLTRKLANAFD